MTYSSEKKARLLCITCFFFAFFSASCGWFGSRPVTSTDASEDSLPDPVEEQEAAGEDLPHEEDSDLSDGREDPEAEPGCFDDEDCDDRDPCSGEETCDTGSGACLPGTPLDNGTVCSNMPRSICIDSECRESVCGDCTTDPGNGEFCDDCNDDPNDGCDFCRTPCEDNDDCGDADICNGEETCDTETGFCTSSENAADGTVCSESPRMICLAGACGVSICGDGYTDEEADEQCDEDPPRSCFTECETEGRQPCESCAWADCAPPDEICNGRDDNCDGECDEVWECCMGEVEDGCTTCGGTGVAAGTRTCSETCAWTECCTDVEYCNDCDDNCDGEVFDSDVMGSEMRITDNGAGSWHPLHAFNDADSEYAITWVDERSGDLEIYFTRVLLTGEKPAPDVRLTHAPGISSRPRPVYNGSGYGIVWMDSRNGRHDIYLGLCEPDGSNFEETRITDGSSMSMYPWMVFTGSRYFLAWEDDRDGDGEIYIARADEEGSKIGIDTRVTGASGDSDAPMMAFTGSSIGLAWDDEREGNWEVFYREISLFGEPLGSDTRITDDASLSGWPSLAFAGSEFGMAFLDRRSGEWQLFFTRIDEEGSKTGPDILISDAATHDPWYREMLSLVWNGSQYGLAWMDDREGNDEIYFTRLDSTGTKIGSDMRVTNAGGLSTYPFLSWNEGAWAISWYDDRDGNNEIYFTILGCEVLP